jgi:glycosyltransferase involved in cell wall biosynthesis
MAHGLQLILDAAQDCRNRLPEVHFLIVGSGAELTELQGQASERELKNVTFVGRVTHDEILGYWQLSDVTLVLLKDIPLFRTVIPSKVFEAMATGTPVISNVRGELQALLEPTGSAVIIEPSNLNALVDAIEMLVRDPERRRELSDAGVKAAVGFDRNKLADKLLDALLALSEKRAKGR